MATAPEASAAHAMRMSSDAELVSASLPGASMIGCVPWLLAFALPWPVGLIWGLPAALLALALGIAASKLLGRLRAAWPAQQRARAAEREFERRYARAAFEEAAAEAALVFAAAPELHAVALLHAFGLPHGGLHFASMQLGAEVRYTARYAPLLADLQQHPKQLERIRNETSTLAAAEAERARALIAALPRRLETELAEVVIDGMPCDALFLRREHEPLRVQLNLFGVHDQHRDHPAAQLLELMLELGAPKRPLRRTTTGQASSAEAVEKDT